MSRLPADGHASGHDHGSRGRGDGCGACRHASPNHPPPLAVLPASPLSQPGWGMGARGEALYPVAQ
jgi:hypothetical protein